MIGYIARICEHYQKTNPEAEKLPVVLPIVLYQGNENWTRPTQFKNYFEINEQDEAHLTQYIPDFKCEIISLPCVGSVSNQELRHTISTTCPILK